MGWDGENGDGHVVVCHCRCRSRLAFDVGWAFLCLQSDLGGVGWIIDDSVVWECCTRVR